MKSHACMSEAEVKCGVFEGRNYNTWTASPETCEQERNDFGLRADKTGSAYDSRGYDENWGVLKK